jgi:hypothetical protein
MTVSTEVCAFIPLRTAELLELLLADPALAEGDRDPLRQLAELVQGLHHLRCHRKQVELRNAYEPFDPDTDDTVLVRLSATQKQQRLNGLMRDIGWVLDRAHFRHLSRDDFEPFLAAASDWGIHMDVDFSAFEHAAVFARGEAHETRVLRSWRTLFSPREVEVPIFRRLVLILKLRPNPRLGPGVNTEHVYMKIFKDIPRADVDMLMPGARVKLRLLDRGKIGAGLFSGLATVVYRVHAELQHLIASGTASGNLLWGLVAGAAGYGYKSYLDYQQKRQAYHLSLTQSLYFQNLDSNAGVLSRLFEEAEEQETRTTLLAYYCLWRFAPPGGATGEDLGLAMDLYLDRHAGVPLLCHINEALALLGRVGLAHQEGDRYTAAPLPEAIEVLRVRWADLAPRAPACGAPAAAGRV